MSCFRRGHRAALTLSCVCLSTAVFAQQRGADSATTKHFSTEGLQSLPTDGWRTNGGNLSNQRYSPLTQVNRDNVASLKGVWRTRLRGSGAGPQYSGEAQPLVDGGVIYVITGADDVFAIGVESGEILWQYTAELDPNISTVCCGWTSRGVGLSADKVFVGRLDGRLIALDRASGKELWAIQAERWQEGFTLTSAPLYFDGMVITGFAGAELGIRGRVKAYDADDGQLLWTFYTIPGPGEPGHDSWPSDNDVWQHGGASVWQTPAVDPELGLLYFSTGNPGPDFNGAVRAGDNLYSASIVAIDVRTGEYRWHYQQIHHDIWDYDASNPVVLMDVRLRGRTRKAIVQVNKTGWAYILDRETGKPLIGIDERPVPQEPRQATAATQPYPRGDAIVPQLVDIPPEGFKLVNEGKIFTPFVGAGGVIVNPSLYGGANWPPSSYDPQRQTLFVCASSVVGNFIGGDRDFTIPPDGQRYEGGAIGFAALPRTGIFAAVDMTTNELVWRYRWPEQCYSGSVATAGGLVFVGRNDGRLTALDSDTGLQLWEFQTGAGMNAPASVFEHRGKQHVVAYSAGNVLIGSAHGDSVWLFALDGTLPPASPRDGVLTTGPTSVVDDAAPVVANLESGAQIYEQACVACHGADGKGGHGGGAPLDKLEDVAAVMQTVTAGRNSMPPFETALTREQIDAVSKYVVQELFD